MPIFFFVLPLYLLTLISKSILHFAFCVWRLSINKCKKSKEGEKDEDDVNDNGDEHDGDE